MDFINMVDSVPSFDGVGQAKGRTSAISHLQPTVIPAKAGIQHHKYRIFLLRKASIFFNWIPAFAGMTMEQERS